MHLNHRKKCYKMATLYLIYCVLYLLFSWYCVDSANTQYIKASIKNYFSDTRHHDPKFRAYKYAAKEYIYNEFLKFGLRTEYHTFQETSVSLTDYFQNVIGILRGTNFGTVHDRIIGLGAHYDTFITTKGVDDNGAGVAAMLEVVRQLSYMNKNGITRRNTIVFAGFDLEEYGGCQSCSLRDFAAWAGSRHFVKSWIPAWLSINYGNDLPPVMHGVIIMDTMMEYNTSSKSQKIPERYESEFQTLFNDTYASIASNNFRGDFLNLIYRKPTNDSYLSEAFHSAWTESGRPKYQIESFPLPFVSVGDLKPKEIKVLSNFLRSDHANFWENGFPAIWITDSANFRGDMIQCYHAECDNEEVMLTDENINFLGKTADALVKTIHKLSEPSGSGTKEDSNSTGMTAGGIIGIIIAVIVLQLPFIVAYVLWRRNRSIPYQKDEDENPTNGKG
ncbi:uncharacterized protein LOC127700500 isoform X2 [Mytilus californianus]|uniref:uncharacterized protein LOC127700500 isoform X2 n=1 Tax=Mytilus californianus TaxID=6549 RepID=UPI002247EDC9|nr:uncharacterized protein LOC127700500 isoform X2 [Mytilus californianus]